MAKIFEYSALSVDGVAVDRIFDEIKDVERAFLNLVFIKLERLGYLDKTIVADNYYEYFAYSTTADGIDYLLENEEILKNFNQKPVTPKSAFEDFEDEIPF